MRPQMKTFEKQLLCQYLEGVPRAREVKTIFSYKFPYVFQFKIKIRYTVLKNKNYKGQKYNDFYGQPQNLFKFSLLLCEPECV